MNIKAEKNLGDTDRAIRAIIAVVLVGLVLSRAVTGWWAIVFVVLAGSQFIESWLGY